MRKFFKAIKLLCLSIATYPLVSLATPNPTYTSSEHLTAGQNIKLHFDKNDMGETGYVFSFSNSLSLSYGDLIMFGDFYGDPDKAIALGKTKAERKERFLAAFHMFATNTDYVEEAKQIMEVVHDEQQYVLASIANGEKPEDVYARTSNETSRKLNCITGGGCNEKTWWLKPGRYITLAEYNYDHFGDNALIAYKVGHAVAMQQAITAGKNHDKKGLEIAYAMNAFASHFLSDRFSAGHVRTPRQELNDNVTPDNVGAALAGYMHNEENEYGLHVHNTRGNHWISYGDESYFSNKNKVNRSLLSEALQISADHIFNAYQTNSVSADTTFSIIPDADEIDDMVDQDISPLFFFDAKQNLLLRRSDTENVYDQNWTSDWWGWSTLIELQQKRGIPTETQRQLALSKYKDRAIQDGLITDKNILNMVK